MRKSVLIRRRIVVWGTSVTFWCQGQSLLRNPSSTASGVFNLSFSGWASLTTSARFTHSSASSPSSELFLAKEVHAFVPPIFTSLHQISRQIPAELLEQISSPSCGGLRQLLARHPDWYEAKQIGQVHVARRRFEDVPGRNDHSNRLHHERNTEGRAQLHSAAGHHQRFNLTPSTGRSGGLGVSSTPHLASETALAELRLLFPDFLVPVKALWTTVEENAEAETKRKVLDALRTNPGGCLSFYAHPAHRVSRKESSSAEGTEAGEPELSAAVLESGYVQLDNSAPLFSSLLRGVDDADKRDTPTQADLSNVRARLSDYTVQPYEWYRVARVLPTAAAEVPFGTELHDTAAALLPSGRDVWQVLLSAPHLFTVRCDDSPTENAQPANAARVSSTADLPTARVFVRFHLHPRFIPAGVAFVQEAELLRELEAVAVNRAENRCGLTTRQRRHKRKLQRQLTYLRNPTPYFDDRVLAQHLFDLLPLRDGVHQSALLGALPPHAVSAFSQNVTDLLKERADLFRLSDARHGVLVQRADAPLDEPQRTVDSVTEEEVLQYIFASYSTHHDPRSGTTVSRSLPRLPRLIRERLFAMHDVVQELLCLYPEKVEVLSDASPSASATAPADGGWDARSVQQAATQLDERAKRELQNVRGRRDFLVLFRFVGEWQAKLTEKYVKQQERELTKSNARRRPAHHPAASRVGALAVRPSRRKA